MLVHERIHVWMSIRLVLVHLYANDKGPTLVMRADPVVSEMCDEPDGDSLPTCVWAWLVYLKYAMR